MTILDCAKKCFITSQCTSINYRQNWKLCDLVMSNDAGNRDGRRLDLYQSNITTLQKSLAGKCVNHNCKEGQKCEVNADDNNPKCVEAYCKGLPNTPNAAVDERFGLRRNLDTGNKYKCNKGYKMKGNPFAVCQSPGHWKVLFNCTTKGNYCVRCRGYRYDMTTKTCIKLVKAPKSKWEAAREICQRQPDGDLVSITTKEKWDFIIKYLEVFVGIKPDPAGSARSHDASLSLFPVTILATTIQKTKETNLQQQETDDQSASWLPGIGIKTWEQIMNIREGKGFVTESDLATISHLRVTMALLSIIPRQYMGSQNRREVRQVMGGWYEDHPEVFHEYQVPQVRATMAPEKAPANTWKKVGFLDEIPVADPKPADEGICISRVTVATVGRDVVIVPDDPECSIRVVQDGLGVVLGKYSVEQICDAQSKDPEFKWLTEWLDDNSCQPAQGDLFRSSQPAKFYWTIKERFRRQMSSDDGSTGGSPKRSWAAEEKKEQREVSPRGRHQDRVPSVEGDVPSQRDTKGQEGGS
ncbi:CSMD [Mytilus edulis]|uniref:CSMD n=1 Tax=Mytilus edulis TaxID=6550 RepID=A0A8S3T9U2_MYTED|nr:CSMD [Mytilus edulis]